MSSLKVKNIEWNKFTLSYDKLKYFIITANFSQDFTLIYSKILYKMRYNEAKNYWVRTRSFRWKITRKNVNYNKIQSTKQTHTVLVNYPFL